MSEYRAMLVDTLRDKAFFLLRKGSEERVLSCYGEIRFLDHLDEIGLPDEGCSKGSVDSIQLIPFCQAKERGFEVHDDNEKIKRLKVEHQSYLSLETVCKDIKPLAVTLENFSYNWSGEDYEAIVARIISEEIGRGEGANFVISRRLTATLKGDVLAQVLAIFRSLLVNEYGAYWTYVFYDGEEFILGASPERHISMYQGRVSMNPISGTFRKDHSKSLIEQKADLLAFLQDEKEIFELFMVTDEELKMMCQICESGGTIEGPFLKEMAQLIHTEYVLRGISEHCIADLLRASMYAPTVTGSPIQNAFRVLTRYEKESRSYYSAMIAMIGRDEEGEVFLDAPITIRSLEISREGDLLAQVGATLVRSSKPADEVKETEAKLAGVIRSMEAAEQSLPATPYPSLLSDESQQTLMLRNQRLSRFWMESQQGQSYEVAGLCGKTLLLVDFEDDFSFMIQQILRKIGLKVKRVSWQEIIPEEMGADMVFLGPGPGDPLDLQSPKIQCLRKLLMSLLSEKKVFFAECLSHQVLCAELGIEIVCKESPYQGVQQNIDLFGQSVNMGFYNTFVGRFKEDVEGVDVAYDLKNKEIHALKGTHFYSVQFHPESILSPQGVRFFQTVFKRLW
ncbi:MAG: anthranilate synthase family protein [bacterium]